MNNSTFICLFLPPAPGACARGPARSFAAGTAFPVLHGNREILSLIGRILSLFGRVGKRLASAWNQACFRDESGRNRRKRAVFPVPSLLEQNPIILYRPDNRRI